MADKKIPYIQTTEHAIVSEAAGTSARLEPGERVLFNEESDSHKHIRKLIEAEDPSVAHLSLVEVDPKAEAKAGEERAEMLVKAEEIAAEQRAEETQALLDQQEETDKLRVQAQEEGQPAQTEGTDFPPQDEEAMKIAEQSGAGQRASTQEDVADEDQPRSGRRSSKKS